MNNPFDVEDLSGPASGIVQHCCIACGKLSPAGDEGFTLFSSRFGWRLLRQQEATSGQVHLEWRCPSCWREFTTQRLRA